MDRVPVVPLEVQESCREQVCEAVNSSFFSVLENILHLNHFSFPVTSSGSECLETQGEKSGGSNTRNEAVRL